jgi:hypothetical protein
MTLRKRLGIALVLIASLGCAVFPVLSSQPPSPQKAKVDVGSFMAKELLNLKADGDTQQMAIWLSYEFLVESAVAQGLPRDVAQRDFSFVKDYQIVLIACATLPRFGAAEFASPEDVRARATLKLSNGATVKPLEMIPQQVALLVDGFKKTAAMDGNRTGANMHLLLFPSTHQGKPIIDVATRDKLTLLLNADKHFKETVMVWRTPFDTLMSTPPCPACQETVSAQWPYCPWCGAKLAKK